MGLHGLIEPLKSRNSVTQQDATLHCASNCVCCGMRDGCKLQSTNLCVLSPKAE
jgi:hypothetical protein